MTTKKTTKAKPAAKKTMAKKTVAKKTTKKVKKVSIDDIRIKAYEISLSNSFNSPEENWFQAEKELVK